MDQRAQTNTLPVQVIVAKDNLHAWLELKDRAAPPPKPPELEQIIELLEDKSIAVSEAVREQATRYVALFANDAGEEGPAEIPERFLIAEGFPPVEAVNGEFIWVERYQQQVHDWQGDASIDYYSANSILTIDAGTEIGRILPPSSGKAGRDVFGKELMPRQMSGAPIKLGSGLRTSEQSPEIVVTEVAGRLEQDGQTLAMKEVLQIQGDVDFSTGNVDSVIDVHVSGDVKPKFQIKTSKSITIGGAVEAATLEAGRDIQIRGGIFGRESNYSVQAVGNIAASICDGVRLTAAGDLCVTKEILNSQIAVEGQLRIERGSIIGGEVRAREGMKIRNAGSELNVATRLAVGIDGAVLCRAQQMDIQVRKQLEQASQIQKAVAPLLNNMKRLTPAQREQATELMSKAMEIETAAERLEKERKELLAASAPRQTPTIDVLGTVYPGVVLIFGLREATVKLPLKGPLRVEERQIKGVNEIVMVNPLTGSVISLPNGPVDVNRFRKSEPKAGGTHGNNQR